VTASDVSEGALALAKENAELNGAAVKFVKSDLFARVRGRYDIIVSNPPYIPSKDIDGLQREVKDFEPRLALDGGADGLDYYRRIAEDAPKYLAKGGSIILEVGIGEAKKVVKLFKRGLLLSVLEDCDERVTIGEDLVTVFSCLQIAESLYVMDHFWPYHYRINSASMIQSFSSIKYEKIDILRQTLLSLNDKYHTYDYRTQIYTDYLDLYFRTVENQILSSADDNLLERLRVSFSAGSIKEAIAMSDQSMLSKKYRLYLFLMKHGLIKAVVLIRRMKSMMK
jgi:hypothetical protein